MEILKRVVRGVFREEYDGFVGILGEFGGILRGW